MKISDMSNEELIAYCQNSIERRNFILFEDEVFAQISPEQARLLADHYASDTLMMLPRYEIEFFEWLRQEDEPIWLDLWGDESVEPYLVGMYFLPRLIELNGRGFPICDLMDNDNFYFTVAQMQDDEGKATIEVARNKFENHEQLTIAQLLALEISLSPIDIWHFAYKHSIKLADAKKAVAELVDDHALVHITKAELLARFIDV